MPRIASRFLLLSFLLCLTTATKAQSQTRSEMTRWLKARIIPNEAVPRPSDANRGLVLSYLSSDKRLLGTSALYDNALAAIALTIEGEYESARTVLDAIMRTGGKEARLFFTLDTSDTQTNPSGQQQSIIRSGASAWAGYAFVFYIRARLLKDPDALRTDSTCATYLGYAQIIADTILKRLIRDPEDKRLGLITGGHGSYFLRYDGKTNTVVEKFSDKEVIWCSIEHNIDAYFFLSALAKISDIKEYETSAETIADALTRNCWNSEHGQFNRGMTDEGQDTWQTLDCASWGALFLHARNSDALAMVAFDACARYRCPLPSGFGYKPYINAPVYPNRRVGNFYFKNPGDNNWNRIDMMWTEGALGVSLAAIRLGNKSAAEEILTQVMRHSHPEEGIKYSSIAIEHHFTSAASSASAAWMIICLASMQDNETAALFWDA